MEAGFLEIFLATFIIIMCFIILGCLRRNKDGLPTNWPVVGMLPALLFQVRHGIYEWVPKILLQAGSNFLFKGPWFSNMKILATVDPANAHYILNSNFTNFPKGPEFKVIFHDVYGDGIFNSDSDQWRDQRKTAMPIITHKSFQKFLLRTTTDNVQNGLVSVLNDTAEKGCVVDLQDIFQRFTFDSTCKLVTGFDPGCLSTEFPEIPFAVAADDVEQAIFYRHILPESLWKLQRWLGVGWERKTSRAKKTLDLIVGNYIEEKKKEIRKDDDEGTDLLASYMHLGIEDTRYFRDTFLNFFLAGKSTIGSALTWFFWNLSQHPSVENKIREEITLVLEASQEIDSSNSFVSKLVYLHATICESLRLYPPVPWNHKRAIKPDILPSGHHVDHNIEILFSVYAMGRMPSIWGEDCSEFRPERWITDKGVIKHEPSSKFLAFGSGPRTCLGKDVTFTQIKIIAVNIIQKFDIKVVECQDVKPRPSLSIILCMKNGLKVKVVKRS